MKKYIIITALSLCSNIWTMEHTKKDQKYYKKHLPLYETIALITQLII